MAHIYASKLNIIYLLCIIMCIGHLSYARQVQLTADNIAASAKSTDNTNNTQQLLRHESYDNIDDVTVTIAEGETDAKSPSRHRRQVSDWFIAPNTRWCGRGNSANGTYNHLGGASMADKCCRKHDHCKIYIPAMDSRYELFNYRPYTLSHCSCDMRFRTCLKMASDEDANTIGKLFFNIVQTQCFLIRKEPVCQQHSLVNGINKCVKFTVRRKAYLKDNQKF